MKVIDDLEAKLAAATPGPWLADVTTPDDVVIWGPEGSAGDGDSTFILNVGSTRVSRVGVAFDADARNAVLIAAAVNALPALLAVVKAAQRVQDAWIRFGRDAEAENHLFDCLAVLERRDQ